jgi:cytochrome c oxidase subunit 1
VITSPYSEDRVPHPRYVEGNYLTHEMTLKSWLLTTDHKRIAILYIISITAMFVIGGLAALLVRLELLTPESDLVNRETYNRLFTLHGVIMVWFFLVPSIPATLGNFLVPLMVGARDMAFPRLNLLSWYLNIFGAILVLFSILAGGADTGWTFYTPYSTVYGDSSVVFMILGIFLVGFSSILTGLNIIVTTHTMRAPGMTWFRLPLFIWSNYATSLIMILATPVLAITLVLVAVERLWGVGIFNPELGGDPVLFQHLFWFYSHPAVYIMIVPGMGVVSETISCFSRNRVFGYRAVAFASIGIAVYGFLVWGHHMFVSGQSMYASLIFSVLSFLVAVPSAIKVFNWTATLRKGRIYFTAPLLYAFGFIGLFVMGGLTGIFLASIAVDVHVHDTYFVVAHFHFIMVGGMVTAYLGGIHFWWPKISGRKYPEPLGIFSALAIFVGFLLTFFPQYILGYQGMPRRYASYPEEFQILNVLSTAGASILAVGYVFPLIYLLWTFRKEPDAGPNPWNASGLEWKTASPPVRHNFDRIPQITQEAYTYESDRID